MRKGKRLVTGLASVVAVSLMLAGCSGNGNNGNGGTASSAAPSSAPSSSVEPSATGSADPVKLTLWGGVPPENGPQEVVDNWNKENPDIQLEYVRFVNDDAGNLKLDTALMSSQPVDMYVNYDYSLYEKRIKAGNALDLSTFSDYSVDEKMGEGASFWKADDKYYGVPTSKGPSLVWLNKDMLDAKGLPVPTEWGLDELRDYAAKLKDDNVWGLAQSDYYFNVPINGSMRKQSLQLTNPDGTSAFDNPFTVKTLQVYLDMMFTDKSLMPHTEQITSKPALDQMFVKGEAAMLFSTNQIFRTTNNLTEFPRTFKVAAAPAPKVDKDQADYIYAGGTGDVISINPRTKNPEAAWKFIKWYADGGMLPMAAGGRVPASKDFPIDEAVALMFKGVEDTYDLESIKRVIFGDLPLGLSRLDRKTGTEQQAVYDNIFSRKLTPEEGAKELARVHNKNLQESSQ
ncbi:ABC transporter substrate-binding protein [Cohnella phaseoli]|uniref:Carbohydrate ABC transporter substrate-binding protein (CUT1 family) n=1 Tax=Cohnella phaseoli TaxID=456490 RepID=A0A3D9KGV4_9BACL|nr:extracellular solute-binding protein [Cohnella phaseoli]RED85110.1 carbohydrate ABC transporter substrate-binding protein (CUT1 family) [Cohnella phaseoli]